MKDEGICRFCLKSFSGRGIGKHLLACKAKTQKDMEEAVPGIKTGTIYLMKMQSFKPFWLYVEIRARATLSVLDKFLRDTWVNCCGHLSLFTLDGIEYAPSYTLPYVEEKESMEISLAKILKLGDKFQYEYDFGSTTYIDGQVMGQRTGVLAEDVRILARNNIPEVGCSDCGRLATKFCTECDAFYCDQCLLDHKCGDETALPVVNSPRMGICGYTGEDDQDEFDIQHRT